MQINGLAVTAINEDKLISTQIIHASQTMKAALLLCVYVRACVCVCAKRGHFFYLMLGNVIIYCGKSEFYARAFIESLVLF